MKTCNSCAIEKPLTDFYSQDGSRHRSMCKTCYSAHNSQQRQKHREKRVDYDKSRGTGWDRTGRENYEPSKPEKHDKYLERTYGITLQQYDEMLSAQGGKCAICKEDCNRSTSERLCVDHCHETGLVRGLLCFKCNVGLGRFDDDTSILYRAIDYLKKAQSIKLPGVFVCGPMSGLPNSNYPAFNKEAKRLRAIGHRVENPAENPIPMCGTWQGYMRMSIQQLMTCDAIRLLPGWELSKGASLERHIADSLGMLVLEAHLLVAVLEAA